MAVSKRVRYEVLRRDAFTCRYCRSNQNEMTVDHVTPVSLGGSDNPDNLVAACKECNAGKSSISPDSETLDYLSDQQVAYETARAAVVAREEERAKAKREVYEKFATAWDKSTPPRADAAQDWRATVGTWISRGLSIERIIDAVELASSKTHLPDHAIYAYMCKVAWNWVAEIEEEIRSEAAADRTPHSPPRDPHEAFIAGSTAAADGIFHSYAAEIEGGLVLRRHIDGGKIPDRLRYVRAA